MSAPICGNSRPGSPTHARVGQLMPGCMFGLHAHDQDAVTQHLLIECHAPAMHACMPWHGCCLCPHSHPPLCEHRRLSACMHACLHAHTACLRGGMMVPAGGLGVLTAATLPCSCGCMALQSSSTDGLAMAPAPCLWRVCSAGHV